MVVTELLGEKILVKSNNHWNRGIEELRILEISPSKNWVKVMNTNGNKYWEAVTNLAVIEVLKVIETKPENKGDIE